MLATAAYANRYTESNIYGNEWIDNHSIRVPWLNFLTAQSIPEETDVYDYPKHQRSESESSSSSSLEDCYIVLEVQNSRLNDQTTSTVIEEEEEEDLKFAQINDDEDHVQHEQLASPMIIEVPMEDHAVEDHQLEETVSIDEPESVIERTNGILFHLSETSVSDDEFSSIDRNSLSSPSEQQPIDIHCSMESLNSIENLTVCSYRSTQSKSNSLQTLHDESIVETPFTRVSAFDRTPLEKHLHHQIEEKTLPLLPMNDLPKISTFRRIIRDRMRLGRSQYDLSNQKSTSNEPALIHIRPLDEHSILTNLPTQESHMISDSKSNLSTTESTSYRKRLFNRFQTMFNPKPTSQSRSWQYKTIFELFHESKLKLY